MFPRTCSFCHHWACPAAACIPTLLPWLHSPPVHPSGSSPLSFRVSPLSFRVFPSLLQGLPLCPSGSSPLSSDQETAICIWRFSSIVECWKRLWGKCFLLPRKKKWHDSPQIIYLMAGFGLECSLSSHNSNPGSFSYTSAAAELNVGSSSNCSSFEWEQNNQFLSWQWFLFFEFLEGHWTLERKWSLQYLFYEEDASEWGFRSQAEEHWISRKPRFRWHLEPPTLVASGSHPASSNSTSFLKNRGKWSHFGCIGIWIAVWVPLTSSADLASLAAPLLGSSHILCRPGLSGGSSLGDRVGGHRLQFCHLPLSLLDTCITWVLLCPQRALQASAGIERCPRLKCLPSTGPPCGRSFLCTLVAVTTVALYIIVTIQCLEKHMKKAENEWCLQMQHFQGLHWNVKAH